MLLSVLCVAFLGVSSTTAVPSRAHGGGPRVVDRANSNASATVSLSVPAHATSSAPTVAKSLIGLSIEGDRWPEWVGESSVNTYFTTLLKNIEAITGELPNIRVGANSEDNTFLNNTVDIVTGTFPPPSVATPYPEASVNYVSKKYYELSKNLPAGTHMTWGVNLKSNDSANAAAQAQAIINAFGPRGVATAAGIKLDALEIGNEADIYAFHGARPAGWTIGQYVAQWTQFADAIVNATHMTPKSGPTFLLGGFSFSADAINLPAFDSFDPQVLFDTRILNGPYKDYFDTFSQHRYQSSVCSEGPAGPAASIETFMNKATIRGNLSMFDEDISVVQSAGLRYILGETNSISCHGEAGVSNAAAAAVWAIDYTLQAAVRGIKQLFFHEGIGFKYNLIQPIHLDRSPLDNSIVSLAPHIQPEYYAAIVVANLLSSCTSGSRIVELAIPTNNTASSYLSGYAVYNSLSDTISKAIFINLNDYVSRSTTPRQHVDVSLDLSGAKIPPVAVQLRRLAIPAADATSGLTFAGVSYETADGKPKGKEVVETVLYKGGATFSISDTEVVMVTFEY